VAGAHLLRVVGWFGLVGCGTSGVGVFEVEYVCSNNPHRNRFLFFSG